MTQKVLGISYRLADIYFETCALELNTGQTIETLPFHLLLTTLFLQLAWEARESTGDHIRATEEESVGRWVCANVKNLIGLLGTLTPAQEQSLRTRGLYPFYKLTILHKFLGKPSDRIFGKTWDFVPTRSTPPHRTLGHPSWAIVSHPRSL